jgi:hypothetical protein
MFEADTPGYFPGLYFLFCAYWKWIKQICFLFLEQPHISAKAIPPPPGPTRAPAAHLAATILSLATGQSLLAPILSGHSACVHAPRHRNSWAASCPTTPSCPRPLVVGPVPYWCTSFCTKPPLPRYARTCQLAACNTLIFVKE